MQSNLEVVNEQQELTPPVNPVVVKDGTEITQMNLTEGFGNNANGEQGLDVDGVLRPPKDAMKKVVRMLGKERKRNQKLERQNKKLLDMINDAWREKQKTKELTEAKAKEVVQRLQAEIDSLKAKYVLEKNAKESLVEQVSQLQTALHHASQKVLKTRNSQHSRTDTRHRLLKLESSSPGPSKFDKKYPTKIPSPRDSPASMDRFPTKIPSPSENTSRQFSTPLSSKKRQTRFDKENSTNLSLTPYSHPKPRSRNIHLLRSPAPPRQLSTGYTKTMR